MNDRLTDCALCGRQVGGTAVEGPEMTYCSVGCERVATALGVDTEGSGESGMGNQANEAEGDAVDTERVFLHVDGMHCGTCEEFLEAVATKQEGVTDASASYVTETIRVDHDPETISQEELSAALTTVGYKITPREELATVADERKRRPDQRQLDDLLGFRYAAGVLVGLSMMFPYVVVLYPAHLAELLGRPPIGFFSGGPGPGDAILVLPMFLTLTSVVLFFTGLPLLRGAYVSLVMRKPNTDLLVSLTVVSAYVYGTVAFLSGNIHVYYDLTIVIAALVVAAIFYESLVKQRAVDLLTDLTISQVDTARLIELDGSTTEKNVSTLEPDDRVLVREGERVPVDGVLEGGVCTVDEAIITGESLPVRKQEGEQLVGGSVVTDGAATIRVGDPPTSSIDGITTAVWELQSGTHGIQRRSDRVAARIVPALLVTAGVVGAAVFVFGGGVLGGVLASLGTVLVLCPWAVGLSTPLSVARSVEEAMARGIIIFDETVFERLRATDIIVFDKTGTLTTGEMEVQESDCPPELLTAAAELEQQAAHPAAQAIVSAVESSRGTATNSQETETDGGSENYDHTTNSDPAGSDTAEAEHTQSETAETDCTRSEQNPRVHDVKSHATGIEGRVNGEHLLIGTLSLFTQQGWSVADDIERRAVAHRERGDLPVIIGRNGAAEGFVILGDDPRPAWKETISSLADQDIQTVVLTGDNEAPAALFGDHTDVDYVFAGVPPAGKTATIRRLKERGHVTMVGDGTNDGPALAEADLGISLGSGTALASEAADITILGDTLHGIESAFDLATAARRRLAQNTLLALSYNCLVIPLALLGLLNPLLVMVATVLSAGLVSTNSWRPLLK